MGRDGRAAVLKDITFGAVYCRWPLSVVVVSGSEQAADCDIGHAVWRLSRLSSAAT